MFEALESDVQSVESSMTQRLHELALFIAADINELLSGTDASLSTLQENIVALDAKIDAFGNSDALKQMVAAQIAASVGTSGTGLTADDSAALGQLETILKGEGGTGDMILTALQGAIRFDVDQGLTDAQKAKARANIGAISADDVTAAVGTALTGFTDTDLASVYQQARAKSLKPADVASAATAATVASGASVTAPATVAADPSATVAAPAAAVASVATDPSAAADPHATAAAAVAADPNATDAQKVATGQASIAAADTATT